MGRGHETGSATATCRSVSGFAIGRIRELVAAESERVAELGSWPDWIDRRSIGYRIPEPGGTAAGFDAGVACTLDLIPRASQRLAACLHAAYTPAAVEQVRRETERLNADSDTCWWLAACRVCQEGELAEREFMAQVREFERLTATTAGRLEAAGSELAAMLSSFELVDGVAFATVDGGMQGAYIAGHDVSAMHVDPEGPIFVGTFRETLGLDDFDWVDAEGPERERRSGPVHGSRQFVKCADRDEYRRVIDRVTEQLGPEVFAPGN